METKYPSTKIDPISLDEELLNQASTYDWIGEDWAKAEGAYRTYKERLGELEALVSAEVRQSIVDEGIKPTEKMVAERITLHPKYQTASKKLEELWLDKERLKVKKEAWYMRKDLLIRYAIMQQQQQSSFYDPNTVVSETA